jgi:hypothetical protein
VIRTRPGGSLLLIGLAVVLGSLKADDELTVLLLFGGYALTWGLFLLRRRRNS